MLNYSKPLFYNVHIFCNYHAYLIILTNVFQTIAFAFDAQSWILDASNNNTPSKRFSGDGVDGESCPSEFLSPKLSATKYVRDKRARYSKGK